VAALIEHLLVDKEFHLDPADPILEGCLLTHEGACRRRDVVFGPEDQGTPGGSPSATAETSVLKGGNQATPVPASTPSLR
jgi:hypothetical protein